VIAGDVEAALRPAARGEIFLVPQPHPRLGALVVAVCTDDDDLSALPRYARAALSGAHRPRRWLHRPDPPLTAAGKVDRAALATWVAER
jgi:long-chain acyl-CoA synthetase